jgi:AcrR family transcriptional regulator
MVGKPNRNRIAERRAATRREILAAAWESAHSQGLAGLTLRDIAQRIGMQPPSLYTHFDSKSAVYDAMFEQAWGDWLVELRSLVEQMPSGTRHRLEAGALAFFDFAAADPERYLLMAIRTVPGFTPSADAYRPAVEAYEVMRAERPTLSQDDFDVYTAVIGGFISQQLANDLGGQRWRRLLPRAITMFADELGLPPDPKP